MNKTIYNTDETMISMNFIDTNQQDKKYFYSHSIVPGGFDV